MISDSFFPQKIALDDNFCNRLNERNYLKKQIIGGRPTLISSPRRYGKTSLGVNVMSHLKLPYTHLDLFPLLNLGDVENAILGGIGNILAMTENSPKKALKAVSDFFGQLSVSFSIFNTKISVTLTHHNIQPKILQNALSSLDEHLQKKKKRAVLFLDEFQRLAQMKDAIQIEGAIRHVAQQSKNLVFIFSGSNCHLLEKMFDESHRPLYKLCDRLILKRIQEEDYRPFLQKLANETWGFEISDEAMKAIFSCTECHPYYINTLCYRLWNRKKIFTNEIVFSTWDDYAEGEKSTIFREVENLSDNQRKLLIGLARFGKTESLFNDSFLQYIKMPTSSIKQALKTLLEKDFIDKDNNKYRVLDPLIHYVFAN